MEVLIIIFVVICLIFIIFNISFYPFVKGVRFFVQISRAKLGPYKKQIKDVREKIVKVNVKDCPNVEIIFSFPNIEYDKLPVVMFIHGGGWVSGSAKKINYYARLIASYGVVVANIEYSLAPEYKYPVSTIQLVEALNYIYNNSDKYKLDTDKIFIGGTSAGAHLSSQLGCLVSNEKYRKELGVELGVPKIEGLLLINGVYDFKTAGKCCFPGIRHFIWSYVGKKDYFSFDRIDELSTINYITNSYPKVFITAGDIDPLRSQSYELVEVLKKKKVCYVERFFKKKYLNHDYVYLLNKKESQKTLDEMINFIKM